MANPCVALGEDVKRDPQTLAEIFRMESVLEDIRVGLEALENKLSGVTRERAMESAVPMPPEEVLVPLASKIREQRKMATVMRDQINSLRDRLEV